MLGAWLRSARLTASSGAVVGAPVIAGEATCPGGSTAALAGGAGCGDGRADGAAGVGFVAGGLAAAGAGAAAGVGATGAGAGVRGTPLSLSIKSSTALRSAPDWTLPSVSFSALGSALDAGELEANPHRSKRTHACDSVSTPPAVLERPPSLIRLPLRSRPPPLQVCRGTHPHISP